MTRWIAIAALAVAVGVAAQEREQCRYEAERSANIEASAGDRLVLVARAGSLRVEGRSGITRVQVRGRACASSEDLLERLQLESGRSGGVVRVEMPEFEQGWSFGRDRYARLDLVLEVPAGMVAEITDGSGAAVLRGLGRLRVDDGSGELTIEDIGGDLTVEDGSGGTTVRGVRGDVTIEDGSGEVELADVTGSVTLDDGSGGIDITGVGGSVRIDDGSGSIAVEDVRGDFTVSDDGSGSIRHSGVQGRVQIPERGRSRRRG